ncbi:MAG: glycosyltransferase family 4 protein [Polyangiaceae bacterium]
MKVLAFSNLYPRAARRTLGTFNRDTFLALARYCDVRVVSPVPAWSLLRSPGDIVVPRYETQTGIEALFPAFASIPGVSCLHARGMVASLLPVMERLRERFPWDAIVAAWVYPDAVAAAQFAERWRTPLVTVGLGTDLNVVPEYFGVRSQIRRCLSRSARVVAVSHALADRAVELGAPRSRVVVQHNAVDGLAFTPRDKDPVRRRLELPAGRKIVGYVGNHRKIKGTDVLIEAMAHLVHGLGRADVLLVLAGDGELTAQLRARAEALGVSGHVRFVGVRPHDEIPLWMSAFDVLCLPSRREGCPNVVLEALASGRPVVASRTGGVPEILDGRTGILVPPEDPSALASGVAAALDRAWDPDSLRASVEYLSWDAVGRRYVAMLSEVLTEEGGAPSVSPSRRPMRARRVFVSSDSSSP